MSGPSWGLLPACLFMPWLALHVGAGQGNLLVMVLMALLMASHDLISLRIPNMLNALAALCGLVLALAQGGWSAVPDALLGGLVAAGLMAIFFFLGAVGAGDVKALGALGVFVGPWGALELFYLTVLAGGLLAVARLVAAHGIQGIKAWRVLARGLKLPYGLAICAGALWLAVLKGAY
ncbi:MAG: prepilin peptidase [Desulfarculaceae bacterium]|nr:prepilin peptidase [Desulfarculaceae bacterium]MCF8071320.1 prepilin peptidase [Desulfarculaceae bacterium]MCF8101645.1 prepilin peptidase [Desulfarculaceae bacterium]MCF8116746.1 prepilin peptidase [Desulfarculaceae bacterium]